MLGVRGGRRPRPASPETGSLPGASRVPIAFLGIVVTQRCNLDCSYCSAGAGKDKSAATLPIDRLRERLLLLHHVTTARLVEYHFTGGEPLLAGPSWLDEACDTVEQASERADRRHTITLQTNGTLIDDAFIEVFSKHGVSVGLSLDGPSHVNEGSRAQTGLAIRGYWLLRESGFDPGVILCLHPAILEDVSEILDWFESEGIHKVRFNPLLRTGRGLFLAKTGSVGAAAQRTAASVKVVDHMLDAGNLLRERNMLRVMERYRRHSTATECIPELCEGLECQGGHRLSAILPDGRWIPCPRYGARCGAAEPSTAERCGPGTSEWSEYIAGLGRLDSGWVACSSCEAQPICDHGCQASHGGIFSHHDQECAATRLLFDALGERWRTRRGDWNALLGSGDR